MIMKVGTRRIAHFNVTTHPTADWMLQQFRETITGKTIIVDEREGRREAERRGITVIETLGVLREAAALKLLDIRVAVERLQTTSFHVAPEVLTSLLKDFI